MPPDVELQSTDSVFKLVPSEDRFVPAGQKFPIGSVFEPSSNDKRDAQDRNTNVRLTVWDLELTTFREAKEIWSRAVACIAYGLSVADVLELRAICKLERWRVVRDPLPETAGPGHGGHCGFEGLDRAPGQKRTAYKTLLDELAQRCFELARL